jgi:L-fucose mutarotase
MLKNINPLLNGAILKALSDMGHGDEVVVVDAHYSVQTAARHSTLGHSLHMEAPTRPPPSRPSCPCCRWTATSSNSRRNE